VESLIGEPLSSWIRHHYIDNLWTYRQICNAIGINNRTLMRYMREFNIPIRNPSEAVKTQWIRNPDRKLNSRNIITKGTPKRAEFLRNHPQLSEVALIKELDEKNIEYEFQYVVGSYVLDFAFPDKMVDIELDNPKRCGHNFDRLAKTRKRTAELQQLGWTVIYFRNDTDVKTITSVIRGLVFSP